MLEVPGYTPVTKLYESRSSLVYRCRREGDNALVVLKLLKKAYPTPEELALFRLEYEAAKGLQSDGVIQVCDLFDYQNTLAYTMVDIGGGTLGSYIPEYGLSLKDFLPLAVDLASTLAEVHRARIMHKDVNPSNIIFNPGTGQVRLIDFGLSTALTREAPRLGSADVLEGTLPYISPEQTGRMNRTMDYRTDLYSLGATFYHMLTGHPPFEGTDPLALVHAHIAVRPVPPHQRRPEIPETVSAIVSKLLAKTAEERYQSAHGLRVDLESCLERLRTNRPIQLPEIGTHDASDRLQIPQKLYGREREIDALLASFDEVSRGAARTMLVSGAPGIGKSSLVQEVHKPMVRKRGYFCSGKFDQLQRNVPYSALIQAFRDLVRHLLTEREEHIAAWREHLRAAFGPNGQVMIDVIPEIELIIGKQPAAPPLGPAESQNRFHLLFQNFIGVFSLQERSFVLFLDDLQWADASSLKLIHLLMTAPSTRHLFMIGAYRDNEVDDAHPLRLTLEEMHKAGVSIDELTLDPLRLEHIVHILTDTLHCGAAEAAPLAGLLLRKTNGNPFFLNQFLTSLHEDGLLAYNARQGCWTWDIGQLEEMDLTDNVVDLMTEKIKKLGSEAQRALQLAACIGTTFDLGTLSLVLKQSRPETAPALWEAIQEDLIRPIGEAYRLMREHEVDAPARAPAPDRPAIPPTATYTFLHDRVQQAAYALIPDDRKEAIHFDIGRLMRERGDPTQQSEYIFDITNHLNLGRALITSREALDDLAHLNLVAGQSARAATAYDTALVYFLAGIDLLGEAHWHAQYDLSLGLYVDAAEAAYLVNDYEQMARLTAEALEEARTPLDKVRVYLIILRAHMARHQMLETVETTRVALHLLNVPLPQSPNMAQILAGALSTKYALRGKTPEDLEALPTMTDPYKLAAMRILMEASAPVYYVDAKLYPFMPFNLVKLSVRYGNAPYSAFGYTMWGVFLSGLIGEIEKGYQFGELGLRLLDAFDARELKSRVYLVVYWAIKVWKDHFRDSLEPLLEGYKSGLETGDIEYVSINANSYCILSLYAGVDLERVERDMLRYTAIMRELKHEIHTHSNEIFTQVVLNLRGNPEQAAHLSGPYYNEDERFSALVGTSDQSNINVFYVCKQFLAYLFGQYAQALDFARKFEEHAEALLGTVHVPHHYFYYSLSLLALYDDFSAGERKQALKRVAANQKKIKKWAHHAPMNFRHKYDLVEAERARVLGRATEAMDLYDSAIAGAREQAFINVEALASELAGRFHAAQGRARVAQAYFTEARHAYLRWGATAKVEALDRLHFNREQTLSPMTASPEPPLQAEDHRAGTLDLASVIKASQAISGEIVLDRLLTRMMRIVIENAGAQKGYLILNENNQLVIEAEGAVDEEDLVVLQSIPIERRSDLSTAIVNYVANTREPVVLSDATHEGRFTEDAAIKAHQPKSVLCAPLVNQGKLTGLLYLENNLTTGAFTQDRLELLRLLSAEIAISIENARLYNNLEQKVAERTEALRQNNVKLEAALQHLRSTQAQLIQQEKMASLGQLTAGIAHEIKNPLNFVNNFAELNAELAQELIDELTDDPEARLADVLDILEDMKVNAEKISSQGKRADDIVQSMMQHARTLPNVREPTDLNDLIEEYLNLAYHSMQSQGLDLEVTLEHRLEAGLPLVELMPQELGRALINLLNNAFYAVAERARTAGAAYVPMVAVATARHGATMEVRIQDNGPGIPADVMDRIFEPFYTTKPTGSGTGLGLSLAYDIVTQGHNGQLRVESTEGEGATFIVTLPYPKAPTG